MSSCTATKINQKEYLKKYLSGDKTKKKKKKIKAKHKTESTFKIIDDDIGANDIAINIDEELLQLGEDAPQIVGEYVELQPADKTKANKWKSIAVKDEPVDDDPWGRKASQSQLKNEHSPRRKIKVEPSEYHTATNFRSVSVDSDQSPPRRARHVTSIKRYDSDNSPERNNDERQAKISARPAKYRREQYECDQSPPRRKKAHHTYEHKSSANRTYSESPHRETTENSRREKPSRQRKHENDFDQSPPRQRAVLTQKRRTENQSPLRQNKSLFNDRHRRNESSDQSPPRQQHRTSSSRRSYGSNLHSPYRKRSISPERYRNRDKSTSRTFKIIKKERMTSDESPVHQSKKRIDRNSSDQSPPRRDRKQTINMERNSLTHSKMLARSRSRSKESKKYRYKDGNEKDSPFIKPEPLDSDQSPKRLNKRRDQPSNSNHSFDQSPPRRNRQRSSRSRSNERDVLSRNKHSSSHHHSKRAYSTERQPKSTKFSTRATRSPSPPPTHKPKSTKTLDGKKAGLQDAHSLKNELKERQRQEQRLFEEMSTELSGRNADVQIRSTGRRSKRARETEEETPEERHRKAAKEKEHKERYERLGKGLKQIEDHRDKLAYEAYESSKPLARYANDDDLDKYLREQERLDDPMLQYMRQKRKDEEEHDVKAGKRVKKPIYEGSYPENRFGIRPGYRWDGVDRSNGYEQKWFNKRNEKRAIQDEAYKYSVEDM